MKTIAIIAEYNPFHRGHAYQLQEARRILGQDCAVVIAMSGCFTQRGEPALADKWRRARMAMAGGADLVLELPFAYACGSAERFGRGAVQMLQATGLDCHLVFGSESGDLGALSRLAGLLAPESGEYRLLLKEQLDLGRAFPAARQSALAKLTGKPDEAALLASSNNILAVEYLKAIKLTPDCHLQPLTIARQGAAYGDADLPDKASGLAAGATALRRIARSCCPPDGRPVDLAGLLQNLSGQIPPAVLAEWLTGLQSGERPLFLEDFAATGLSLLRSRTVSDLDVIAGMNEGLGRRLAAAAARPACSPPGGRLEAVLAEADTRRFTRTRLQRAMIALMAGLREEDLARFDQAGGPQYLRILGFTKRGRYLLKVMRRLAGLPVITKASDFLEYQHKEPLTRMAELDLIAADLWMLAAGRPCGQDFDTPVAMY
ncbi:MAG: nucleotidyltransferase family protein [Clostridiaceae bacterium]|nr:nucleotidyltransferase family protein [Clostridiaceae bacterium]